MALSSDRGQATGGGRKEAIIGALDQCVEGVVYYTQTLQVSDTITLKACWTHVGVSY